VAAIENGAHKVRINPGNIGGEEKIKYVADCVKAHGIPVRVGANTGSIEQGFLAKYGRSAEALVESALFNVAALEKFGVNDVAISVKASDVGMMIRANRLLAEATDYPIHLGVTEAGARYAAAVKSAVGIGTLLAEGIGDTVRVSLTEDPVHEVAAARQILATLGLTDKGGMNIVSCPTCGRTRISLIPLVEAFEARVAQEGLMHKNIKVALMGCAVNGPGEAREADIGIAGGEGEGLLFKKGTVMYKVPEDKLLDALIDEIKRM